MTGATMVDVAGLLPRHTSDPRAVDEHVYGDVLDCVAAFLTLSASVTSIATTLSLPLLSCAKRLSSLGHCHQRSVLGDLP